MSLELENINISSKEKYESIYVNVVFSIRSYDDFSYFITNGI